MTARDTFLARLERGPVSELALVELKFTASDRAWLTRQVRIGRVCVDLDRSYPTPKKIYHRRRDQ